MYRLKPCLRKKHTQHTHRHVWYNYKTTKAIEPDTDVEDAIHIGNENIVDDKDVRNNTIHIENENMETIVGGPVIDMDIKKQVMHSGDEKVGSKYRDIKQSTDKHGKGHGSVVDKDVWNKGVVQKDKRPSVYDALRVSFDRLSTLNLAETIYDADIESIRSILPGLEHESFEDAPVCLYGIILALIQKHKIFNPRLVVKMLDSRAITVTQKLAYYASLISMCGDDRCDLMQDHTICFEKIMQFRDLDTSYLISYYSIAKSCNVTISLDLLTYLSVRLLTESGTVHREKLIEKILEEGFTPQKVCKNLYRNQFHIPPQEKTKVKNRLNAGYKLYQTRITPEDALKDLDIDKNLLM